MAAGSQGSGGAGVKTDDEREGVPTRTSRHGYPYAPVLFLLVVTVGQG